MADDWFAANAPAEDWFAKNAPPPPAPEKPWIGQPRPESEGFLSSLYHMPVYGLQDIGAGAKHLTQEGTRRQGAHEVFTGLGEASVPAVAAGAIASAPALGGAGLAAYLARLGLTLGTGTAGMALGRAGSGFMGADPETQNVVGDVGTLAGGGLPSLIGETRIGPTIVGAFRGAKEGLLKKYQTQGGAVPGMVRGAVDAWNRGPSGAYLRPKDAMPPPPGTPAARFVPGQYDARVADVPIEVGGAHIPDYNGLTIQPAPMPAPPDLSGRPTTGRFTPGQYDLKTKRPEVEVGGSHVPDYTPPGGPATPLPDVAPVAPAPAGPSAKQLQKLYDESARTNFKGAKFADLPEAVQKVIAQEVNKDVAAAFPPPPGTLPNLESFKASVPQVSIIPEGEHNIIRKVAETNRGNKDMAIARNLKDEGFTAAKLDAMSDADLESRVKAIGYKPSTGKNYSRTWSAFRRDLRSLLD